MNKCFASDNYSGVHPEVLKAIEEANIGHAVAYGEDEYTQLAVDEFKKYFGDAEVFFIMNGTGANVLALEAMKGRASSVICPSNAHIFQDETGAPSKITGMQLLPVICKDGKLTVEGIKEWLYFQNSIHKPHPKIISISQSTEDGTIYTLDELKKLCTFAKEQGMLVHMDGARISNAAVALNSTFMQMSGDLGVDVLSFGGTKNGMMMGEALIFFNKELAQDFMSLRKQNLQQYSKMRFLSAQFIPYLRDNLWYENAKNANDMAKYLEEQLLKAGIEVTNKVLGNTIFAVLPKEIIAPLQEISKFYLWDENKSLARFVTSFDTSKEDIDSFISNINKLISTV